MNHVDFETLATFRYQVRKFLRFSKDLLFAEDLTPDQYQALLAIRAASSRGKLTIRDLAEQMQVRHHSTVGIVDQLVNRQAIIREVAAQDRRKVLLSLTEKGEDLIRRLAPPHHEELSRLSPEIIETLQRLTENSKFEIRNSKPDSETGAPTQIRALRAPNTSNF